MAPDDRIRMLAAQLLRTTNPALVQFVADELKIAVDAYAQSVQQEFPALDLSTLAIEPAT